MTLFGVAAVDTLVDAMLSVNCTTPVLDVVATAPFDAAVKRPYASTVKLACVYEAAVTAVATRSICGVEPPVDEIRPVVPVTFVTADAEEIATQTEPVHTYIVVVVVSQ